MYAVTDAYKEAMKKNVQRNRMKGTIGSHSFTDANILSGSFSITNQCSDTSNVEIGQVYTGELNMTLRNMSLQRYSLKGMQIIPIFGLMLADGTYEDVPLGIFNVSEADWTVSGIVIKAYDNMSLLDGSCLFDQTQGTAYSLASAICSKCGLELGTTEEEFAAFANGSAELSMYTENDIETWRDFLSWVAQACACNVIAGRDGKIYFRSYRKIPVDRIDAGHRFKNASFSDFETRYTGISCVNIADRSTSYYGMEQDDALTMNLGSNPFLQYGLEETKEEMRRAVLTALQQIDYVPFSVSMIGNPAYDLMDVFSFSGGIADEEKLSCMTKFTFKYHGQYSMSGVGQNPALASAKSKTDKEISGIYGSQDSSTTKYYIFENTDKITVKDGKDQSVMLMRYASTKDTHITIDMEFLLFITLTETASSSDENEEEETDPVCIVTATYYSDGTEIRSRHPIETYSAGYHVLGLIYDLDVKDSSVHTWDVWLKVEGGTAAIAAYGVHGRISGSGLVNELPWDGTIDAEDEVQVNTFLPYFFSVSDRVSTAFIPYKENTHSDSVSKIDFNDYFFGFTESLPIVTDIMFSTKSHADLLTVEAESTEEVYSNGTVITPGIMNAREISAVASDGTRFLASFDGGTTWSGYAGGGWIENENMSIDELEAVPESAWTGTVRIKAVMGVHDTLTSILIYGGSLA